MELVILPVDVAIAWYEQELLLSAAAQVRKFHYLHIYSSKNDRKTGPAKIRPARPLATAMALKRYAFLVPEVVINHIVLPSHYMYIAVTF